MEQETSSASLFGVVALVVCLMLAVAAGGRYWLEHRAVKTNPGRVTHLHSTGRAQRGGNTRRGLGYDELSLMLRTGFSDQEVIAAATGKELAFGMDADHERLLRGLGAGDRLVLFLRRQPVFAASPLADDQEDAGAATPVASAPVPQQTTPTFAPAPALMPARAFALTPPVDYAARDRQIASLKRQIDDLDERMRVLRTNPNDRYDWWYYRGVRYGRDQLSFDAYMKRLDEDRNELRRQKWQLEGR